MTCEADAQDVFGARCSELGWETMILPEFVRHSDQIWTGTSNEYRREWDGRDNVLLRVYLSELREL